MEELRIYLDLVDQLGDPFTAFERLDEQESAVVEAPAQTSAPVPPGRNPAMARWLSPADLEEHRDWGAAG